MARQDLEEEKVGTTACAFLPHCVVAYVGSGICLITIFYIEMFMRKVGLQSFFKSKMSEKICKSAFQFKISG